MEKETIEKLKEYKKLLDDGILTKEEFENEKQKLLSNEAEMPSTIVPSDVLKNRVNVRQNRESRKPRTIHIPWQYRTIVMNASTPIDVIATCDKKLVTRNVLLCLGAVLAITFIIFCFTGGFWSILGAIFGALCPAVYFFIFGATLSPYADLKEKFVGMSQVEFEYVQDVIQAQRNNIKEAIITFTDNFFDGVNQAAEIYQQQTGGNLYYDVGAAIGSTM